MCVGGGGGGTIRCGGLQFKNLKKWEARPPFLRLYTHKISLQKGWFHLFLIFPCDKLWIYSGHNSRNGYTVPKGYTRYYDVHNKNSGIELISRLVWIAGFSNALAGQLVLLYNCWSDQQDAGRTSKMLVGPARCWSDQQDAGHLRGM